MAIETLADYLATEDWPDELEPLSSGRARCHCGLPRRVDQMYDTQPTGLAQNQRLAKAARRLRQHLKHITTDDPRFLCGDCLVAIAEAFGFTREQLEQRLGR